MSDIQKGDNTKPSKPYYPYPSSKAKRNTVVPQSSNKPLQPRAIQNAFAKVPVVLGEITVQIEVKKLTFLSQY